MLPPSTCGRFFLNYVAAWLCGWPCRQSGVLFPCTCAVCGEFTIGSLFFSIAYRRVIRVYQYEVGDDLSGRLRFPLYSFFPLVFCGTLTLYYTNSHCRGLLQWSAHLPYTASISDNLCCLQGVSRASSIPMYCIHLTQRSGDHRSLLFGDLHL